MFEFPVPPTNWLAIMPIILVVLTGILALIVEMIRPKQNNNAIVWTCLAGLGVSAVPVFMGFGAPHGESWSGTVVLDQFGLVMQLLLIVSAFLAILFSEGYLREKKIPYGEFYPLLLWSTSGAMIMATTQNLLMIFLGLEILSIALYVMAGMSRREERSEESALKYFLLGAFASGFLLYGIAFYYGATGSLHLSAVPVAWATEATHVQTLLLFGFGLMLIGLSFKSGFVPFHQWTPDVYQGAPTNVTAFMAAASKIGAIAALWRVLDGSLVMSQYWLPALFWIAILTMTVGNLVALVQKDVKRILAYSSIAHAGYILVGVIAHFSAPETIGIATVAYYLLSYSLMTLGAFAIVSMVARGGTEGTQLEDLNGLWRRSPLAAVSLVIFMASLIGVPPFAGFFGKLFIFLDALAANLPALAIVLAVNSILSIAYYLAIAKAAFVSEENQSSEPFMEMHPGLASTCLLCAAGVIAVAIFFGPVTEFIGR
jgi:NADH-quinone oxidoreductase subunit N